MGKRKWLAFLSCVLAMPLCATMMPGVYAQPLSSAVVAGTLLGILYLLVRPLLRLLTFPIGCLTLGLSGFVLDAGLIFVLHQFVPGFGVAGFEWAALCALLVNGLCLITGGTK